MFTSNGVRAGIEGDAMTTTIGTEGLPEQVSMILLGVEQLERSVAFYRDRRDWWEPLTARVKNR